MKTGSNIVLAVIAAMYVLSEAIHLIARMT